MCNRWAIAELAVVRIQLLWKSFPIHRAWALRTCVDRTISVQCKGVFKEPASHQRGIVDFKLSIERSLVQCDAFALLLDISYQSRNTRRPTRSFGFCLSADGINCFLFGSRMCIDGLAKQVNSTHQLRPTSELGSGTDWICQWFGVERRKLRC